MKPSRHPSALRVEAALGPSFTVVEFEDSTHTAAEAAAAIGCDVAQIAKSILFRASVSGKPVMVVASGSNRVDDKKMRTLLGEKIEQASAEFVKDMTGFDLGGVPPLAHAQAVTVFIDQDLMCFTTLWASGGTPNAVFEIAFDDLVRLSGGTVADIAKV